MFAFHKNTKTKTKLKIKGVRSFLNAISFKIPLPSSFGVEFPRPYKRSGRAGGARGAGSGPLHPRAEGSRERAVRSAEKQGRRETAGRPLWFVSRQLPRSPEACGFAGSSAAGPPSRAACGDRGRAAWCASYSDSGPAPRRPPPEVPGPCCPVGSQAGPGHQTICD